MMPRSLRKVDGERRSASEVWADTIFALPGLIHDSLALQQ